MKENKNEHQASTSQIEPRADDDDTFLPVFTLLSLIRWIFLLVQCSRFFFRFVLFVCGAIQF